MALNSSGAIFASVIGKFAADQIERDYIFAATPFMEEPTEETKRKAREFRERLEREGKVDDYFRRTAPKPCPECGRI